MGLKGSEKNVQFKINKLSFKSYIPLTVNSQLHHVNFKGADAPRFEILNTPLCTATQVTLRYTAKTVNTYI